MADTCRSVVLDSGRTVFCMGGRLGAWAVANAGESGDVLAARPLPPPPPYMARVRPRIHGGARQLAAHRPSFC